MGKWVAAGIAAVVFVLAWSGGLLWWPAKLIFGLLGGLVGATVALMVAAVSIPVALIGVLFAVLGALLAVGVALFTALLPILLPLLLLVGLVWLLARGSSRPAAAQLPPPQSASIQPSAG